MSDCKCTCHNNPYCSPNDNLIHCWRCKDNENKYGKLICACNICLIKKIESLERENGYLRQLIEHSQLGIEKCFERIEKLEKDNKQPYKCPVCEGKFIFEYGKPENRKSVECNACQGKGIV